MDVTAGCIHDVQHESRVLPILVARVELRLAFVEQDRLGLTLASRDEQESAIRQVVRRDVVAGLRRDVGRDDPVQRIGRERVLPDLPRRLFVHVLVRIERAAHGEQHFLAVGRDLDAHDVALTQRLAQRDVALRRRRRRAIANVEIGADVEAQDVPHVGRRLQLLVLVEQRALRVGDREIRRDRIRLLAAADTDAAVARAARGENRRSSGHERNLHPDTQLLNHDDPCVLAHGKSLSIR